jgi:hypothetical protein
MALTAADRKANGSQSKPSRLALNAGETHPVVDDQVTTGVLTEWKVDRKIGISKGEHDRELRPVTDRLRMFHLLSVPEVSAGPCPNQTT